MKYFAQTLSKNATLSSIPTPLLHLLVSNRTSSQPILVNWLDGIHRREADALKELLTQTHFFMLVLKSLQVELQLFICFC